MGPALIPAENDNNNNDTSNSRERRNAVVPRNVTGEALVPIRIPFRPYSPIRVGEVIDLTSEEDTVGLGADGIPLCRLCGLIEPAPQLLSGVVSSNSEPSTALVHDKNVCDLLSLQDGAYTTWLFQHGLLRSGQSSIYKGSAFEDLAHFPKMIIKFIYYWVCNTPFQMIIWTEKINPDILKKLRVNIRAICTAAIHQKVQKFGGQGKLVEIRVIRYGTNEFSRKVLWVHEDKSKIIRLRVIDPALPENTMELIPKWVDKESHILIDSNIDLNALKTLGYSQIVQDDNNKTNASWKMMERLNIYLPAMFEDLVLYLSLEDMQGIFDEISWRLCYGPNTSQAFQSIIKHIGEVTHLNSGAPFLEQLTRITSYPFKNWAYDNWTENTMEPLRFPYAPETPSTCRVAIEQNVQGHNSNMIALESYYYGVLKGRKNIKDVHFFSKCYYCRIDFRSVLALTRHLILHALNKDVNDNEDPIDVCRFCTQVGSQKHHQKDRCQITSLQYGCRICALTMKDKDSLVRHMLNNHQQLDLPYICGICTYRVSEYKLLRLHFDETHCNGNSGMCPFCLKIVNFATEEGEQMQKNQLYFTKHIQRHCLPFRLKCERCQLNFLNKYILAGHERIMHESQVGKEGIERFLVDVPTMIHLPTTTPSLLHRVNRSDLRQARDLNHAHLLDELSQEGPTATSVDSELTTNVRGGTCHECETYVTPEHFRIRHKCTSCSFSTYCSYSMAEHAVLKHHPSSSSIPVNTDLTPSLSKELYCSNCPYSTTDGNAMCRHMISCPTHTCSRKRKREPEPAGNEEEQEGNKKEMR